MIIDRDIVQGSDEWLAARASIPTASEFSKIITSGGKASSQMEDYAIRCALAEAAGVTQENIKTKSMERGTELEPEAAALYEIMTNNKLEHVGIVYANEFKRYSCSPDGLIFDDKGELVKGLEIKSPGAYNHIQYHLNGGLPPVYKPQVQGCMWVCGCDEWDFMSYHPDMKPLIITVKKDVMFHGALERLMREFLALKQKYVLKIKELIEV